MKTVGYIATFIAIGFGLTILSKWLDSEFLSKFLSEQLVTVIITLLAINTATTSILLVKLNELALNYKSDAFASTSDALKQAMYSQIVLIALALIIAILKDSNNPELQFRHDDVLYDTLNTAIFIDTIYMLMDVGLLMFDIHGIDKKKE